MENKVLGKGLSALISKKIPESNYDKSNSSLEIN